VSDREEFLAWVQSDLTAAEVALHNGDAGPRRTVWSAVEPVTVHGAWKSAIGRQEVDELFTLLADSFSNCTSCSLDLVAADVIGDMAYTVACERSRLSGQRERAQPGVARDPGLSARGRRVESGSPAR
jgi:hypothetical protein